MTDPTIKYGILRTRDLVELYYGARMVTDLVENFFGSFSDTYALLSQDPRRIKYEIIMANTSPSENETVQMGSPRTVASGLAQIYWMRPGETIIVTRDFFTDLDSVCIEVDVQFQGPDVQISTRETFLTPTPVDEGP
jgi:hypothetical protein